MTKKDNKSEPQSEIMINSPTAFEKMWSEFIQLTLNASQNSFRQDIEYSHILDVMRIVEEKYSPEVEAERQEINKLNELIQEKSDPEKKDK